MKHTIGTLLLLLMAASAWGQNPATTVQSTKNKIQVAQTPKPGVANAIAKPTSSPAAPHKAAPVRETAPVAVTAKAAPAATSKTVKAVPVPAVKTAKATTTSAHSVKPAVAKTPQVVKAVPTTGPVVKSVAAAAKPAHITLKPAVAHPARAKVVPVTKTKETVPAKPVAVSKSDEVSKVDVKDTSTKPEGSEKEKKETSKLINIIGKRDPFISPVVSQTISGSGCSVGKKCLAIDQITVRGIVKADTGMIAVVVNALDKAYFLRENDPVFNGYVVKITEDSIVFKEMFQDKLGKPFTRDVVKRIPAPAV
jgi:hypothetical protein